MGTRFIIVTAFLQLGSTVVNAREPHVGYGLGVVGCGEYLEHRRRPDQLYDDLMGSWVQGFLSARNLYGPSPQIKAAIPQDTILAYLDKFCRDAPLAGIPAGVVQLANTYAK